MTPDLAEQVQQVLKEEGRTMSVFLREAIRVKGGAMKCLSH